MRGMILAAGRGTRMKHLTDHLPKPLIKVGNRYLIEYSILAMAQAGISEVVINIAYRGDQIKTILGTGAQYGVSIEYSEEIEALETGGGILKALPLLGTDPFIVLSADIITNYPLQTLPAKLSGLAHLVLVDNPAFHPAGDFCLNQSHVYYGQGLTYTYANMGIYRPELFKQATPEKCPLIQLLKPAIQHNHITGEHFNGVWHNIGTEDDLIFANQQGL